MNIVIAIDAGKSAHYYQRLGLARAFTACGHNVILWDIHKESEYDCFDIHKPDLLICQTYNITNALINCINENPAIKVIMKASDYGPITKKVVKEFPILEAREDEIKLIKLLREKTGKPDGLFIHYHKDYLEETHGYWIKQDFKVFSDMNAADIFEYTNGNFKEEYSCDIGLVSGYWPYKAQTLNKWVLPLLENFDYKIKIFGNGWTVPQHMGFLPEGQEKDFFTSCKICINIHEPHSQKYGYDIVERPFKLGISKSFYISDYVKGLEKSYTESKPVLIKTPNGFISEIKQILNDWDNYSYFIKENVNKIYIETMNKHTYFDRIINIFNFLNMETETEKAILIKNEVIKKIDPKFYN